MDACLKKFEQEVVSHLLKDKVTTDELQKVLSECSIQSYDFTGAGYFLDLSCKDLKLVKQTIDEPLVTGKNNGIEVGFLLFVDNEEITIECHGWGGGNLPENIRELDFLITVESK
jgi:hypothetical protein